MKSIVQQFKMRGDREDYIFDVVYSQTLVDFPLALHGSFYQEFTP